MNTELIATVLAEHGRVSWSVCAGCGVEVGSLAGLAAHQAGAIAPLIAAAQADAWDECENAKYEIRLNTGNNTWGAVKDNPYRAKE